MNNKKWQLPFLLLLIIGSILIIQRHRPHNAPFQHNEGTIFGTIWHATYQSDSSLQTSIINTLQQVDASLSMFNPLSTISLINRNESNKVDSLFEVVFTQAQQISQATDGAFDVTVAPLVNAWGFGFKNGSMPDSTQVDSLRQIVGWQGVSLEDGKIIKSDPRMVLDFSAIAKGFGVDQVAHLFRQHGITNFMIEIGGEIVVGGNNPKGENWSIGVNKPVDDSLSINHEIETILQLTDCAMATSGNYRNYYISAEGKKLAHTIDPATGYPVQHSILSSTVLAPTCAMADAFATSFMVMGLDKAKSVLDKHPELQAYFIYTDSEGKYSIWSSASLSDKIK